MTNIDAVIYVFFVPIITPFGPKLIRCTRDASKPVEVLTLKTEESPRVVFADRKYSQSGN